MSDNKDFVTNIYDIPIGVVYVSAIYRPSENDDLMKGWIPAPAEKQEKAKK